MVIQNIFSISCESISAKQLVRSFVKLTNQVFLIPVVIFIVSLLATIIILSSSNQISSTSNSIVISIEEESLKIRENYNSLVDTLPIALESIVELWNDEISEFVSGSMKWSILTLESSVNIGIFFITDMFKGIGNSFNIISNDLKDQVKHVNNQIRNANNIIRTANEVPFVDIESINKIEINSNEVDQLILDIRDINIQPLSLDSDVKLNIDIPKPEFDVEILKIPIFSFATSFEVQMKKLLQGYMNIGYVMLGITIITGIYCLIYIIVIFFHPYIKINISILKSDVISIEFLVVIGGLLTSIIIISLSIFITSGVVVVQNNIDSELSKMDNHVEKFIKNYNKIIDDGPNFMKNQTQYNINLAIKSIEDKIGTHIRNVKKDVESKISEIESKSIRIIGLRNILRKIPTSITIGRINISKINLSDLKLPVYSIKILFSHHIFGIIDKIFIVLSSILIIGIILFVISLVLTISMIRSI